MKHDGSTGPEERTSENVTPGQIPAPGGRLIWDQSLHLISGRTESVFKFIFPIFGGPNVAKPPSMTSETATEDAAFDLSQLVDVF